VDDEENLYVAQWNSGKCYPYKLELVHWTALCSKKQAKRLIYVFVNFVPFCGRKKEKRVRLEMRFK
jgi:hypothetical protein